MNRASLLHILDHAGGISEAEVRELEQLAAAFPYCQTAHLLLAKAAHDRGSMLAGQRLRRAATYAADRELLRALIERPGPAPAATPSVWPATPPALEAHPTPLVAAPEEPLAESIAPETPAPVATPELASTDNESVAVAKESIEASNDATSALVSESPEVTPAAAEATQPIEAEPEALPAVDTENPEKDPFTTKEAVAVHLTAEPATEPEASLLPESTVEAELQPVQVQSEQPDSVEAAVSLPESGEMAAAVETPEPATESAAGVSSVAAEFSAAEGKKAHEAAALIAAEGTDLELVTADTSAEGNTEAEVEPADIAPTGAALLAAGVATLPVPLPVPGPDAPATTADELPPAAPPIRPPVEAGSSRFEFGLGEAPEPLPTYQLPELPEQEPTPPASFPPFRADELLAYALSGGSRLGSALTLRTRELTTDLPQEATWPADAATLAHLAANRPVPPPAPSSLALIDKFLRSQPRIKNAQRPTSADSPQADLSVRSTSATPSLASESLAKIMVKQGKIGRAIEIYEQLMQRQPEKKAYFAAQIDLLNQHPE